MFHSFVLSVYFLVFINIFCQLPVFYLLYFICISYIYCSRVIYLVGCLVCENIVTYLALGFIFSSLVWSHSSCRCPCLFRFVVFQYFHSYVVSYFMLIRVFVILLFSVTVSSLFW